MSDPSTTAMSEDAEPTVLPIEDTVMESSSDDEPVTKRFHRSRFVDLEAEVSADEDEHGIGGTDEDDDDEVMGDPTLSGFLAASDDEEVDQTPARDSEQDDAEVEELSEEDRALVEESMGFGRKRTTGAKLVRNVSSDEEDSEDEDGFIVGDSSHRERKRQRLKLAPSTPVKKVGGELVGDEGYRGIVYEIFGSSIERFLMQDRSQDSPEKRVQVKQRISLADPQIEKRLFRTPEQIETWTTDIPERLQARAKARPSSDGMRDMEIDWLVTHALRNHQYGSNMMEQIDRVRSAVENVVALIRDENMEIPYIALYRRDAFCLVESSAPELSMQELWIVNEWDAKWDHFSKERAKLEAEVVELGFSHEESYTMFDGCISEADLADIRSYLRWREDFYRDESECSAGVKRNRRGGVANYEYARSIFPFAELLCHGNAMVSGGKGIPGATPPELAMEYIVPTNPRLDTLAKVFSIAHTVASKHMSMDPAFRRSMKARFFEHAEIATRLTDAAIAEVDWTHEYFPIRHIHRVGIREFEAGDRTRGDYLLIKKAMKEKFMTLSFRFPKSSMAAYMKELSAGFDQSILTDEWLNVREQTLKLACDDLLFPTVIHRDMEQRLDDTASRAIARECCARLASIARSKPCRERVCAAAIGSDVSPSYVVMLDENGNVADSLILHHLKTKPRRNDDDRAQSQDKTLLTQFLERNRPGRVAVDAVSLESRYFKTQIEECTRGLSISVEYCDPDAARIASNSFRSKKEFHKTSDIHRYTISLGRLVLDPLAELCGVCSDTDDMLALNLHPLQKLCDRSLLVSSLHRTLIEIVGMVGVDINAVASRRRWAAHQLEYVAGLGPTKAHHLCQWVGSHGRINSRESLSTADEAGEAALGPCVFRNAAGFLLVQSPTRMEEGFETFPLIETSRIHPDHYNLLDSIITSVLRYAEVDTDEFEGVENRSKAIAFLRSDRKLIRELEELDLDAYASALLASGEPDYREALKMIREEVKVPCRDNRRSFEGYSVREIFTMLTNVVPGVNLRPGQKVTVLVQRLARDGVFVRVDDSIPGFIKAEHLSDELCDDIDLQNISDSEVADRIREETGVHRTLLARIRDIDESGIIVHLDSRRSVLERRLPLEDDIIMDDYRQDLRDREEKSRSLTEVVAPVRLLKRNIQHPNFKNMILTDAVVYLKKTKQSFVIRPSSETMSRLSITILVRDEVVWNIPINELDKPEGVQESLGRKLTIGDESFTELDEIIAMFIDPLLENMSKVFEMLKFRSVSTRSEIVDMVSLEYRLKPNSAVYFITLIGNELPCRLQIAYRTGRGNVNFTEIKVTPEGFRFQKQNFQDPRLLVNFFKNWMQSQRATSTRDYHSQRPDAFYQAPDQRHPDRTSAYSDYGARRYNQDSYERGGRYQDSYSRNGRDTRIQARYNQDPVDNRGAYAPRHEEPIRYGRSSDHERPRDSRDRRDNRRDQTPPRSTFSGAGNYY